MSVWCQYSLLTPSVSISCPVDGNIVQFVEELVTRLSVFCLLCLISLFVFLKVAKDASSPPSALYGSAMDTPTVFLLACMWNKSRSAAPTLVSFSLLTIEREEQAVVTQHLLCLHICSWWTGDSLFLLYNPCELQWNGSCVTQIFLTAGPRQTTPLLTQISLRGAEGSSGMISKQNGEIRAGRWKKEEKKKWMWWEVFFFLPLRQ